MMNYKSTSGFTLLELLVVMAIVGTATIALYPAYASLSTRKDFQSNLSDFETVLASTRLQAFSRDTTTRITTVKSGDSYMLTSYASSAPTSTCSTAGTWQQMATTRVDMNIRFVVTGTGIGNICFFRDGTSTGGNFAFAQKDSGTDIASAAINIYISTGFVDVTKQ